MFCRRDSSCFSWGQIQTRLLVVDVFFPSFGILEERSPQITHAGDDDASYGYRPAKSRGTPERDDSPPSSITASLEMFYIRKAGNFRSLWSNRLPLFCFADGARKQVPSFLTVVIRFSPDKTADAGRSPRNTPWICVVLYECTGVLFFLWC